MTSRGSEKRRGLTLIEVVVSTVIVAFIISASLQTVATTVFTRTRTTEIQLGPSLARGLLCEILRNAYRDPDTTTSTIGADLGEGTGNRLLFDDVDDFHGWTSDSPVNPDGSSFSIGAGWRREVAVEYWDPANSTTTATDLGLKHITVTVTSPNANVTVMETMRSTAGANERQPSADRQIVAGANVAIEMMSGSVAEATATLGKNHAFDE